MQVADATRFRLETERIGKAEGWQVISHASSDQFRRGEIIIEVIYSAKDYISEIIRYGPQGEHVVIPYQTVAKIDLLRMWLTGRRSNVISPSVKRDAGVDW